MMWFWWFMLFCDILIPVIMIGAGRWMWKRPPKNINWIIGFRTTRSMMNADTWEFAHTHSGRLWWRIGWILLPLSILAHLPVYGKSDDMICVVGMVVMIVQLIVLIGSVVPTEQALKRTFTDDGQRR